MPTPNFDDVINGATPLEMTLAEVHPRLHLTAARLDTLRRRKDEQPWRTMFDQVRRLADRATQQIRAGQTQGRGGPGGRLPEVALAYLIDGREEHLAAARDIMLHTCTFEGTDGHGSFGGCWLYGLALAYDWLYHVLDAQTLQTTRAYIARRGSQHCEELANHRNILSTWYTCNHLPNYTYDLVAGGLAIYNDQPNMGPWIRQVSEKVRQMIHALGPDGVSQEGVGYGEFYTEYLVKSVDLIRDLLGVDFFAQSPWLRNAPKYHLYSALPRASWAPRDSVMAFGDTVRYHWHGPDTFLLRLAGYFRDEQAQWLALELNREGLTSGSYICPIWYDPTVPATPPSALPPSRHFEDHGLSLMRSGWDGSESLVGLRCAPFSGHKIQREYNGDIGGGHMHPDAGSILLFARGEWLLTDAGYCQKLTAYRNTIVVNGIGQTGEKSAWFEGVELRRERRGPAIRGVESGHGWEAVHADLTGAYEHAAKVKSIERFLVFLRPDCWVILDRVAAEAPSTFDLYFHADRPFVARGQGPGAGGGAGAALAGFELPGEKGTLALWAGGSIRVEGFIEKQPIEGISGHGPGAMDVLRLRNAAPAGEAVFVTVLEARATGSASKVHPRVDYVAPGAAVVELSVGGQGWRVELTAQPGANVRVAGL